MRLEQLVYFETLVREESFHKAAEKLHIAQPSLTANIKAMEKELNKKLLVRGPKVFALTEEGKKVLEFAKTVSGMYRTLQNELNQPEKLSDGVITMFAPKFFSEIILEGFMESFQNEYPNIKINLIENNHQANQQNIENPQGRMAFVSRLYSPQPVEALSDVIPNDDEFFNPDYTYMRIFQDVLGLCAAKDSPVLRLSNISIDSVAETDFPHTAFPFQDTRITDTLLISSNSIRLHKKAMVESNAYCSLPYFVYREYFADDSAFIYRGYDKTISIHYYLVYPKNRLLTPQEQCFAEELHTFLLHRDFK